MLAVSFLLAISFLWAGLVEPNIISIEKITVNLEHESPLLENTVFMQVSDFHFESFGAREQRVLERMRFLNPDYVFITGDIVNWDTRNFEELEIFLTELVEIAPKKTFAVYGNHEHRNAKIKEIENIFLSSGMQLLRNEHTYLEEEIYLIGVDDPHLGFDDLDTAMEGVEKGAPKILLAHSPEIFEKVIAENILVLSGHTHGGQINIPFLPRHIMPLKHQAIDYREGLFRSEEETTRWLYVNRGIGNTFLPFRLNSPPEITIIKIHCEK